MWSLLYGESKPHTATRKVGLLKRVMDDQRAPRMDFGDWFLRLLDLVGGCAKARGCMIDDGDAQEISQGAQRSLRVSRVHSWLEFKFPVMRELIQHWCQSRRVFFPQKPPMEVAAVSTAASDSDVTVSAVGWHGSWHEKGHGKGKSREKGKEKGKGKGKGKKGKEKGGEKGKGKSNSWKGKGSLRAT